MPTPVLPDVELVAVTYLRRTGSRVRDLVGDRVYTVIPTNAVFPLLRLVRIGGAPVSSATLHLDAAAMQLDAAGGSKADARRLLDTARAELADMNLATHTGAVVTAVTFGPSRYLPDKDFTPAKPRYVADVTIYAHP